MGGYSRAVLGNGSINTFLFLGGRFLIMQQLDYNNRRAVFSMWSMLRCCKQGTRSVNSQLKASSARESAKRGLDPEAEEEPLLEPLPGNI
jgi:hypothetical protein